jgi:hypothetical protein
MRLHLYLICALLLAALPLVGQAANLDEKTTTYYLVEGTGPSGLALTTKDNTETKGWAPTRALADKSVAFYTEAQTGEITGGTWAMNLWYKRLPAPVTIKAEVIKTDAKGGNVEVLGTATANLATNPKQPWPHTTTTLFIKVGKTTLNGELIGLRLTKTTGGDMEIGFNANDYDSNLVMVGTTPFVPKDGGAMNFTFRNCTNVLPDSAVSWTMDQKTWHPLSEGLVIGAANRSAARMYMRVRFPDAIAGGGSREYADFVEYNLHGGAMLVNTTNVDAVVLPLTIELVDTSGRSNKVGISESQPALIKEFLAETPDNFHDCIKNNRIYQPSDRPGVSQGGSPDGCAAINRGVKVGTPEFTNPDMYYLNAPCNYYSKFVHAHTIDGRAYGFAYDDDCEQAAFITTGTAANMIVSIYWMDKGDKLPTAPVVTNPDGTISTTSGVHAAKDFAKIEACAYDDMGGAQNENADTDVGFFDNEDWLCYNDLKFNPAANAIDCVLASDNSGGKFEIRLDKLDGPKIGECTVTATGGWGNWKDVMVPITPTTGTHNLFIVGTAGAGICNFQRFSLVMTKTPTAP